MLPAGASKGYSQIRKPPIQVALHMGVHDPPDVLPEFLDFPLPLQEGHDRLVFPGEFLELCQTSWVG